MSAKRSQKNVMRSRTPITTCKSGPVLAIDTSCDETAVAVTYGRYVLSNAIASQIELHRQYGGVFPTVAKQAHQDNLAPTVRSALRRAGVTWSDLAALAVTQGPGLAPALEIGLGFAQDLARQHHLPVVPVNHIEGHVLSVLARPWPRHPQTMPPQPQPQPNPDLESDLDLEPDLDLERELELTALQASGVQLPALAVVVSGGHTEFVLVTPASPDNRGAAFEYQRLGWTIDDAAGEALDKVGRMLDLGYPAGPVIEQLAPLGKAHRFAWPLPMTTSGDYNLSFSGLKTFGRNRIAQLEQDQQLNRQTVLDLAAGLQTAVFRHITHKLTKVLRDYPQIEQVWLGGGVAANTALRRAIRQTLRSSRLPDSSSQLLPQPFKKQLKLLAPYSKRLCGDNAAMIGVVAGFKLHAGWQPGSQPLERQPRWEVGTIEQFND